MGYHEDCPQCGNQLPDGVSTNDGLCTDCWQESYNKLEGQYWDLASKNNDLKAENASLKAEIEEWKQGAQVEADEADAQREINKRLKAEVEKFKAAVKGYQFALTAEQNRVKELEDEIQEDKDELRRIVEDDRARDEIHCGCCVQLRMKVKEMEGLLDGLAWDDNVDHHDKDCQCGIHKARRFLEMLDTERGKPE